jgi:antitoxin component YwqK of YwqJK toxin-antitoxin module
MKTIVTIVTVFTVVASVVVADEPDFEDPKALKKILGEAILQDTLEERERDGAKLLYAPDSQIPYTGWVKSNRPDGSLGMLGFLKKGKPEGSNTSWDQEGRKMKVIFKNGKLEGPTTATYPNGQNAAEGTFRNNELEGKYLMWYPNGKPFAELTYKDGKLDGPFTRWDERGGKIEEGLYKNGVQVFESDPDLNDPKILEEIVSAARVWNTLEKDAQTELYHAPNEPKPYTGWFKKLHDNQKVEMLGALKEGKPDGLWTWWSLDGKMEQQSRFKDGTRTN